MGGCSSSPEATGRGLGAVRKLSVKPFNRATIGTIANTRTDNAAYIENLTFLHKVPLLKTLPVEKFPLLVAISIECHFTYDEKAATQGDMCFGLFIIKSGEATATEVHEWGSEEITMKEGDYFGEQSLFFDAVHPATVRATTKLTCLYIHKSKFKDLRLEGSLWFPKRRVVQDPTPLDTKESEQRRPNSSKSPEDTAFIVTSMMQHKTLEALDVTTAHATELAENAWLREIEEGAQLIGEGEGGASLFVVASGAFDILKERSGCIEKVGCIGPGDIFGELALFYSAERAATVKATKKSSAWIIERAMFKCTMMNINEEEINEYTKYLDNCEAFNSLLQGNKRKVALALRPMNFRKGDVVLEQNTNASTFYILFEGEVEVIVNGKQVRVLTASVQKKTAQYFGELALLQQQVRAATIKVISEEAKTLVLERAVFSQLLETLRDRFDDCQNGTGQENQLSQTQRPALDKPALKKLKRIGVLSRGRFGSINLMKCPEHDCCYAVKVMSKGRIAKLRSQRQVVNEMQVLRNVVSPFIVKLAHTHQDQISVYLFFEPMLGGDLSWLYFRKRLTGSKEHAMYYSASVALAFEHLHERYVIYRGLKMENLLLDTGGRLKLADFSVAKFSLGRLYTTCGTPEYFAPEIVRTAGQTVAVDWWTLGILIFELMVGVTPFKSEEAGQMLQHIIGGIDQVRFPPSKKLEAVVKGLLQNDPAERLPMRAGGIQNLKGVDWFSTLDWTALADLKLKPPYEPRVKSSTDISNFPAPEAQPAPPCKYKDDGSRWDKDF